MLWSATQWSSDLVVNGVVRKSLELICMSVG
jgi:hypothetical protein